MVASAPRAHRDDIGHNESSERLDHHSPIVFPDVVSEALRVATPVYQHPHASTEGGTAVGPISVAEIQFDTTLGAIDKFVGGDQPTPLHTPHTFADLAGA